MLYKGACVERDSNRTNKMGHHVRAVRWDGLALQYVESEHKTRELCLEAVKQNGWGIKYVPERLRTPELCSIAVTNNPWALQCIQKRTMHLYLVAVRQNGLALEMVPSELMNRDDSYMADICMAAVRQDGFALEFVGERWRTKEIHLAAVRQHGYALIHVEKQHRTPDIHLAAVSHYGDALELVEEQLRTEALCRAAVAKHGSAIRWVPEQLRTLDLYTMAVEDEGCLLGEVPARIIMDDICICIAAIKTRPDAFASVPAAIQTPAFHKAAIEANWMTLEMFPTKHKTIPICIQAVQCNGKAIMWVPWQVRVDVPRIYLVALDNKCPRYRVPRAIRDKLVTYVWYKRAFGLRNPHPIVSIVTWAILRDVRGLARGLMEQEARA